MAKAQAQGKPDKLPEYWPGDVVTQNGIPTGERVVSFIPPGFKKIGEAEWYGHAFDQIAPDANNTEYQYTVISPEGVRRTFSL